MIAPHGAPPPLAPPPADGPAEARPAPGADAADHDHHEHLDEDELAHPRLHRVDRPGHQAGEAGERSAYAEYHGVEELDVDAQGADHGAVGSPGAHQHAKARASHDVPKNKRY